jgi:hypothetical protein
VTMLDEACAEYAADIASANDSDFHICSLVKPDSGVGRKKRGAPIGAPLSTCKFQINYPEA